MLAISRGGRYTLANVVPACRSCNASKWNAEVTTWMRRKKLDERRPGSQVTIRRASPPTETVHRPPWGPPTPCGCRGHGAGTTAKYRTT